MARKMEQVCLHSFSQSVSQSLTLAVDKSCSFPRKKAKQSAQEKHFVVFLSLKPKQNQPFLARTRSSDHLEQGQPGEGMGGPQSPPGTVSQPQSSDKALQGLLSGI